MSSSRFATPFLTQPMEFPSWGPAPPEMKLLQILWSCWVPNPSGHEAASLSEGQGEPVTLQTVTVELTLNKIFTHKYVIYLKP